jgi:hypothetical protein
LKISSILICGVLFLVAASSLQAGDAIFYGVFQKPGEITADPENLYQGNWGGAYGARFSATRVIGYEQNFEFSPKFAKPGVKAFQMDSNLQIQAKGKIAPYVTAGIGYIKTWGQDYPADLDPEKIAAAAYSFGTKFSFNYGGGIKMRRITGPIGFNIDLRRYSVPNVKNKTLNIIQMGFGLVFTW